jgi:hypothetical protein
MSPGRDEGDRAGAGPGEIPRRSPRVPVVVQIEVRGSTSGRMSAAVVDLGAYSARLRTERPLVLGEVVILEFPPGTSDAALSLTAIVWEASVRGAIAVFANLDGEAFRRLRTFVDRRWPSGGISV